MSGESAEAKRRWSQQNTRKRRGETTDAGTAFKKIRFSAEHRLASAKTREMIAAHFQANDDIDMPTYRVSLMCPLSKRRMSVAARGIDCTHIQCFDLEQYLQFQVQTSLWACPIAGCSKQLRVTQLRVDQYFCDALEALRNRPEVTEVDLLPNGDYVAVEPPVGEDLPDDGSPYVPEPVEPKREPVDSSDEPSAPARDATTTAETSPAESDVPSSTFCRRRQRKSGNRHGSSAKQTPETEKLLNALAKKEAELNCREEELQSASEEIQRLREALAGKEREQSQLLQELSESNADRARLRQSLEEAVRPLGDEAPAKCIPCEIRSLEEQIKSVQQSSGRLKWDITKIENIKKNVRTLEATVGHIEIDKVSSFSHLENWDRLTNPFDDEDPLYKDFQSKVEKQQSIAKGYRYLKTCESYVRVRLEKGELRDAKRAKARIDGNRRAAENHLAQARALRLEILSMYRNERLPARKLEELAHLRERLEISEQQEKELREKLQEATNLAPAGN